MSLRCKFQGANKSYVPEIAISYAQHLERGGVQCISCECDMIPLRA
jgi:hypothetical protein